MATVMTMHWPEVSKEQYEQARQEIDWVSDTPQGAKFHVAWHDQDGLRVLDVWESPQDFERFTQERLMPVVQRLGIAGQPKVEFAEPHDIFAPNV